MGVRVKGELYVTGVRQDLSSVCHALKLFECLPSVAVPRGIFSWQFPTSKIRLGCLLHTMKEKNINDDTDNGNRRGCWEGNESSYA